MCSFAGGDLSNNVSVMFLVLFSGDGPVMVLLFLRE